MYNFNNSKKFALIKKDKSNKQSWDRKIIKLCNKINSKDDYFTTSSCSGRIVFLKDEKKKKPGLFLFRTHKKITFSQLKKELQKASFKVKKGIIIFKQEPCLLSVSSRNKESQWQLFNKARNNGWKKSGILSIDRKFLVELISTENISFPIINDGNILVNDNFLKIIIKKANYNLNSCWKKIDRLFCLIK